MPPANKNIHSVRQIFQDSRLPRLETEILLAFQLRKNREYILTHPETKITSALYNKFKALETKRLKDWPIAYLTGHKEFYGSDFRVDSAVLTPRPETEMMVDEIINIVQLNVHESQSALISKNRAPLIIDLGTGSGAIIISLAAELRRLFPAYFKNISFKAVDISSAALTIAKRNAQAHHLGNKIKFFRGNLLTPLNLTKPVSTGRPLIIAANLPYLTPAQIKKSPSIRREPKLALDGGKDGLKYYRILFKQLTNLKLPGSPISLLCEIDPRQSAGIKILAKKYFFDISNYKINVKTDLADRKRLAIINL